MRQDQTSLGSSRLGSTTKENASCTGPLLLRFVASGIVYLASGFLFAQQQQTFQIDPAHSTVNFTLGDVLHTVRGTFQVKSGSLKLDAASGKLNGEIVVDGKSGVSGNSMRDRKMNREVLESDRYPEIAFRPDQVEGPVATQGKSSVKVHGMFSLHGVEREMTVPAEIEIFPDHWNAMLHFEVPYQKWGVKNPSTLFLKVSDSVQIDIMAAGIATRAK